MVFEASKENNCRNGRRSFVRFQPAGQGRRLDRDKSAFFLSVDYNEAGCAVIHLAKNAVEKQLLIGTTVQSSTIANAGR